MKRYIVRQVLTARLAALTLSVLCFWHVLQVPVRAQEIPVCIVIFPSVGLAPGETLRLTLFNPDGVPVRAQARSHHSGGIQVCLGDGSVRFVSGGVVQTFDVDRGDISLTGEAGTGRIQLRASLYISIADLQETTDWLAVSMETISISDGTSNTFLAGEVIRPVPGSGAVWLPGTLTDYYDGGGNAVLTGGDARDILMGIVPGQTLRVNLINLPSSGSEAQRNPGIAHVKVFDGSGHLLAQSDELVIPQGEIRYLDINHTALPILSGSPTARRQIRVRLEVSRDPNAPAFLLPSAELIDSTGRTTVLTGQHCLVFYLGGMPGN